MWDNPSTIVQQGSNMKCFIESPSFKSSILSVKIDFTNDHWFYCRACWQKSNISLSGSRLLVSLVGTGALFPFFSCGRLARQLAVDMGLVSFWALAGWQLAGRDVCPVIFSIISVWQLSGWDVCPVTFNRSRMATGWQGRMSGLHSVIAGWQFDWQGRMSGYTES